MISERSRPFPTLLNVSGRLGNRPLRKGLFITVMIIKSVKFDNRYIFLYKINLCAFYIIKHAVDYGEECLLCKLFGCIFKLCRRHSLVTAAAELFHNYLNIQLSVASCRYIHSVVVLKNYKRRIHSL